MLKPLSQVGHLFTDLHGSVPLLDFKKSEQFVTLLDHLGEFSLDGLVVSEPPEPGIDLNKTVFGLV
jgi:hypothetical protein